jgi:hypothetical protein
MKLLIVEKISFKEFIENNHIVVVVDDTIDSSSPSSCFNNNNDQDRNTTNTTTINNHSSTNTLLFMNNINTSFDDDKLYINLKEKIIESFGLKNTNYNTNNNNNNNMNNNTTTIVVDNSLYLLDVYFRRGYSSKDILKNRKFSLEDVYININYKTRDIHTCISCILLFFIAIIKRECKQDIQNGFEGIISLPYLLHTMDKKDYINIINLLIEDIDGFPSYGLLNTNIKISMNYRLYKNDLCYSLYFDIGITEYISIEKVNIKYPSLRKYIKNSSIREDNRMMMMTSKKTTNIPTKLTTSIHYSNISSPERKKQKLC